MQFPGKLTNEPNKKMTKKTDFGQDPDPFGAPKFFVGFTFNRCCILLQAIIVFNFKKLVLGLILAPLAQIWAPIVFCGF